MKACGICVSVVFFAFYGVTCEQLHEAVDLTTQSLNEGAPEDKERDTYSKCFTYKERYDRCSLLRHRTKHEIAFVFSQAYASRSATEVALIRPGTEDWSEDHWLNMCAFILEATDDPHRHAYILVMREHLMRVPAEFLPVVQLIDQKTLSDYFGAGHYINGWYHGDLEVAWWTQQHRQYDFIWAVEADVRFIGHYGDLFTQSRKQALAPTDSYLRQLPVIDPSGPADLITWSKLFHIGSNYTGNWMWTHEKYMHGQWKDQFPENATGALLCGMGMSRRLTEALIETVLTGTANSMQEVFTPTVAASKMYKMSYVLWEGPYHCCKRDLSRQFYSDWKGSETLCYANHLIHPIKSNYTI